MPPNINAPRANANGRRSTCNAKTFCRRGHRIQAAVPRLNPHWHILRPRFSPWGKFAGTRGLELRARYSLWRAWALRAKITPDEAEAEGFGGSKVEAENEVWRDLRCNPEGWGQFSPFLCRSSLADTRYASLLASRTGKNWLPAPTLAKVNSRLYGSRWMSSVLAWLTEVSDTRAIFTCSGRVTAQRITSAISSPVSGVMPL